MANRPFFSSLKWLFWWIPAGCLIIFWFGGLGSSCSNQSQKDTSFFLNLNDTVDYGAIVDLVVEDIESDPCDLIEHLGGRIADRILFEFHKINRVSVTIHKPSAPVNGNVLDIAVTIERNR